MARRARPWYQAKTDGWYVTQGKQQLFLGKHPDGAPTPKRIKSGWNAPQPILDAFHRLMSGGKLPDADEITVAKVCDLFLGFSQRHNSERDFKWYLAYLQDFCKTYGRLKAAELKPFHVTQWLDAHGGWTSSRRHAIVAVKRAFNWADREGVYSPSPIRNVRKPPATSRPNVLTRGERQEILAAINDAEFRQFVEVMQESGARPSEIARLTAENVNLELGVCVLHRHKTVRKTRRPRVIYMTPRFVEIVTPLLQRYPEGPLFRGPRLKKPFGLHGICARFRRLREKMPHLTHAVAYAVRHGFTTDALMNGVGVAQVAELLGHRDTTQVMQNYSHIHEQTAYMREMARRASQGQ